MTISLFNCLLLLMVLVTCLLATSEFSLKGDPCAQHDTCKSKSVPKTCSCDKVCHAYGTCCQDVVDGKSGLSNTPSYFCYDRRSVTPVFVKRTCSEDFRGHVADTVACVDDDEDEMDVRNNLLMTSRKTKVTYWNKHCASCNNEARADLDYWNIEVFCPQHEDVSRRVIRTNLTFDEDKRQWGLMIGGEFLSCAVRYAPPHHVDEVKLCASNMITSCPEDYSNEEVSSKCSNYYAERKAKNSDLYFKNIHCAICNNADIKELECPGMSNPEENIEENDFNDMVEEIFTDGEWLGKQYQCSRGYIYDPTRGKCRRDPYNTVEAMTVVENFARDYGKSSIAIVAVLIGLLL